MNTYLIFKSTNCIWICKLVSNFFTKLLSFYRCSWFIKIYLHLRISLSYWKWIFGNQIFDCCDFLRSAPQLCKFILNFSAFNCISNLLFHKRHQITKHRTFWSSDSQRYIKQKKNPLFSVIRHKTGDGRKTE